MAHVIQFPQKFERKKIRIPIRTQKELDFLLFAVNVFYWQTTDTPVWMTIQDLSKLDPYIVIEAIDKALDNVLISTEVKLTLRHIRSQIEELP
jgi:hypothetical protein